MHGTIVVADKSKTVRRMVEIALAKHPFDLEFAEDGNAASAAIKAKSPVIAIVDAALPGVDGYDLTQQIKSGGGDTKVLLLVGRNSRYDAGRGRSAGVDDHLTKPFLTQKLVEKVFGAVGESVPDAAIFRTSLLSIPLAGGGTASPGGLTGGLAAPSSPPVAAAPKAPVSIAAPAPPAAPAAPAEPQPGAFEQDEPTRQYAPPEAGDVVESAAQMVLDAAAFKEALGEEGPAREMFERVVWEVVPQLAEAILKEEIAKVVRERMAQAG